ncbi:MAG: hypothetical protein WCP82_00105 [Alphaproteobacteria bacterium]
MRLFSRSFRMAWTTAVLAVALFSYASVASVVMQAGGATPFSASAMPGDDIDMAAMAMGGMAMDMPGMPMDHGGPAEPDHGTNNGKPDPCAFCSAAAHLAVMAFVPPLPCPTAVAWRVPPIPQVRGQCGPLAFRATARGPPNASLMS